MVKIILCIFLSLFFFSCASQLSNQEQLLLKTRNNLSRIEQNSIYEQLEKASKKKYNKHTKKDVMDACYQVLSLMDPRDSLFQHGPDIIVMKRTWFLSLGIITSISNDYWIVKFIDTPQGTLVTLRTISKGKDSGLFDLSIYPEELESTNLTIHQSCLLEGDYYTFFKRVDYMLGVEPVWYDCSLAKSKIIALCMPKNINRTCMFADDLKPAGVNQP